MGLPCPRIAVMALDEAAAGLYSEHCTLDTQPRGRFHMKVILIGIAGILLGMAITGGVGLYLRDWRIDGEPRDEDDPDRVVGVQHACTYVTIEPLEAGAPTAFPSSRNRVVPHEGTGEFCDPSKRAPFAVGRIRVHSVENLRTVVTVRTAAGSSYTVETSDTNVNLGDMWPR